MSKLKRKQKREEYIKRFNQRYGMTREEFRELKKSDPQLAHEIRLKTLV